MSEGSDSAEGRNLGRWTTALLSGGGLAVSWYLLEMHVQSRVGEKVGGALCGAHEVFDCGSAARSEYAELFGIPIALLSLGFYAALIVLALLEPNQTRISSRPFRPAAIATTLFMGSLGYSLFLGAVSAFQLQSLCPFCVMLYLVNGLGLLGAMIWSGERPDRVFLSQVKGIAGVMNRWSLTAAVVFGVCLLLGNQTLESALSLRIAEETREREAREVKRLDPELYRISDAPGKGPVDAPVHLVEFSNFSCPHCSRLAAVLDQIAREYGDKVRIEFRHFPIASQPQGHRAARAAQCAHQEDLFWPMHDRLFLSAADLSEARIEAIAGEVGLDRGRFQACMGSESTGERVDLDVHEGHRLDVKGTPTFFINGLRVGGAIPLEAMRDLIDEELARVGVSAEAQ